MMFYSFVSILFPENKKTIITIKNIFNANNNQKDNQRNNMISKNSIMFVAV